MPSVFYIKRGDLAPSLAVILRDGSGAPIDLTEAESITFHMEPSISAAAAIVSATEGQVKYDWQDGNTDTAGRFKAEFEIEWPDDVKQTVPNHTYIYVYIREDIG